MIENKQLCFLGAGSIAEAMIAGILAKKLVPQKQITVVNQSNQERLHYLTDQYGIHALTSNYKGNAVKEADIIILAVKPKDIVEGLKEIQPFIRPDHLVVSVVAGVSTALIAELLQHKGSIVRTMPNTSAMVGLSATAITTGENIKEQDLHVAVSIMEAIGTVVIVEENQMDIITGLSGTGPAYLYFLAEAMEEAAVDLGLNPKTARELIIQTMIGAGHMLKETMEEPAVLRKKVTSPNGTTMAGLEILKKYNFQEAMIHAIKKATERSKELGTQFIQVS